MNIRTLTLLLAGFMASLMISQAHAESIVKPFVLASSESGDLIQGLNSTRAKLGSAGFEILGEYSPYPTASIIVFTNATLKNAAKKSARGGYGGALRASVTEVDGKIQVVYTDPVYWSNAYRMEDDLQPVGKVLSAALGDLDHFGTGEKKLTTSDMRKYHYTVLMEYFDDPSDLAEYTSHQEAVEVVEKNLRAGAGGARKVFRLDLGEDPKGKQMTLFGVALDGSDTDECSGDKYIMGKIDRSSPRHTAHLPYEILVYGPAIEALYARFRIALSWPHLPMLASETGATFFSIMCAPGAIERALTLVAGNNASKGALKKTDR